MGEMKTLYGKLYAHTAEETDRFSWQEVDRVLFGGMNGNNFDPEKAICMATQMIQEQFDMPLQNVWRVSVLPSGMVEVNDFTLPSNKGKIRETFKQEDLPVWIQDSLSVLMIVDQGVTVEGLGKKISDSIFYVLETPEIKDMYGS
jgi:hypothetical protein